MKTIRILYLAALALIVGACSNDNELVPQQPEKSEGIPFTATIGIDNDGALTRAIAENSEKLTPTWEVGDEVALIHNGVKDVVTVSDVDSYGFAAVTGKLTGSPASGDAVTVIYPASAADGTTGNVKEDLLYAAGQLGTLDDIAAKYDVRRANTKLKVDGGTATFQAAQFSLANQFCIFKLTVNCFDTDAPELSVNSLCIRDADGNRLAVVTPSSGMHEVYVALPTTSNTLKFYAQCGSKTYYNMSTTKVALEKKYYKSTITLATLGDVMLATGKCAKAGTSGAVAMLSLLPYSTEATKPASRAFALEDASSTPTKYYLADDNVEAWAATHTVTGGTWAVPTALEWLYSFENFGGSDQGWQNPDVTHDVSEWTADVKFTYGSFKAAMTAAGSVDFKNDYWTCTSYLGYNGALKYKYMFDICFFRSIDIEVNTDDKQYYTRAILQF